MACRILALFFTITLGAVFAQPIPQQTPLGTQAFQAFATGQYQDAERDFREVVRLDPSNIYAQIYLGHSL